MKILDESTYVGPSLYALFPVMRLTLDLGPLEAWPSGRLGAGFQAALLERLPGLQAHTCSYGEPGGFVRRLTEGEGTWLGHVLEHVAIELQNVAGSPVSFGKTRGNGLPGQYDVVFEYAQADVGREAGRLGLRLLQDLLPAELRSEAVDGADGAPGPAEEPIDGDGAGFSWEAARDDFIRFAQRRALGPSTAALVRAAEARDVPWLRLNDYSLIQLGYGIHGRRIQATITSETRAIAVELASDKEETNRILGDLGLPVPRQALVYSPGEAVRAARRIGYPVVVKPLNANHGRGVSIDLQGGSEVEAAFAQAREHGRSVVVERFIQGLDHRLLVVGGELVAAAKRVPGHVQGDGRHSIAELIEIVNQDPRRGIGHEKVLTRLELDYQAERLLAQKGYTAESVPPPDEIVFLRSTGNLSTGGTSVDVTDTVHPDNRDMAIRAARAIGLDVAGIDFLTTDITLPWSETGGAICEVNAAPGFRMHVAPSEGRSRDVAGPVMDMLFPPGSPSRIPVAAITGTNGKTTTSRMTAHIHKMAGRRVGLTSSDGVYIDGRLTVKGDMTGPTSARIVLRDPTVEVAVLETARGGLLRGGLGFRRCNVGAVINVQSDHLGLGGIHSLEDLARVKRVVVEVARDAVVLNADDPLCLAMADHSPAEQVCYVTMSPRHPLVREHIRAGGRALVLEEGINGHMITIYDNGAHQPLVWTHLIPATLEGRAMHNVQNAMFAAAISFCMGVKPDDIRQGLRTFDMSYFQAPGRMNVFDEHPFRVILDYGHNPAAIRAMVDLVERLDVEGRRIVVLAAPGDRRDEDIVEMARIAAGHFDHYICRRDDVLRGRGPDEVPRLLAAGLEEAGVEARGIEIVPDEQAAVETALRMARPGDLVLVFGDKVNRTWKQIIYFAGEAETPRSERHKASRSLDAEALPEIDLGAYEGRLVVDERGVRLAREVEEESD